MRVFDRAGNKSVIRWCEIVLKTTAPAIASPGGLGLTDTTPAGQDASAEGGYTNERVVNVIINLASGGADVEAIRLSEGKDFYGAEWLTGFQRNGNTITTTIELTEGDGVKKVYAQVRDRTKENLSNVATAVIALDREVPTATMLIDTPTSTVETNLLVDSAGADYMRMVPTSDAVSWSAGSLNTWLPYAGGVSVVTLSSGDGAKTVRLQFKDRAGNVTAEVCAQTVLDSTIISAPQGLDSNLANNSVWCNQPGEQVFTFSPPANAGPSGVREYYYTTDDTEPTQFQLRMALIPSKKLYDSQGAFEMTLKAFDANGKRWVDMLRPNDKVVIRLSSGSVAETVMVGLIDSIRQNENVGNNGMRRTCHITGTDYLKIFKQYRISYEWIVNEAGEIVKRFAQKGWELDAIGTDGRMLTNGEVLGRTAASKIFILGGVAAQNRCQMFILGVAVVLNCPIAPRPTINSMKAAKAPARILNPRRISGFFCSAAHRGHFISPAESAYAHTLHVPIMSIYDSFILQNHYTSWSCSITASKRP